MSYRDKTPQTISILTRKLKPGKTFADFQQAHLPPGETKKTQFGYDVNYFNAPTRVINCISAEDPSIIISIGMTYGDPEAVFSEISGKIPVEKERAAKVATVADKVGISKVCFVGADNNYAGTDPDYEQGPLIKVTHELLKKLESVVPQKPNKLPHFIPEGYHSITPYLIIKGAAQAIEFYKKAFGAVIAVEPFFAEEGKIGHAELKIGNSHIMLADEFPDMGARSPKTVGGSPMSLMLYVENVDAQFKIAIEAGAKVVRPIQDQFYGDRSGQLEDPFGYVWNLATHKETLSTEEIRKRAADLYRTKS
jgi:PhnB protein